MFTIYHIRCSCLDIMSALAALTEEEKKDDCIDHVIKLRDAWSQGNFVRYVSHQLELDLHKIDGFSFFDDLLNFSIYLCPPT